MIKYDDLELDTLVLQSYEHWKHMLINIESIALVSKRNEYHPLGLRDDNITRGDHGDGGQYSGMRTVMGIKSYSRRLMGRGQENTPRSVTPRLVLYIYIILLNIIFKYFFFIEISKILF